MYEFAARLCRKPGLAIMDREQSWEIRILTSDDLVFEIIVPHEVLEWFVTARRVSTKQDVWSDWMDYYEITGKTEAVMRSEMERDIDQFTDRLLASTFRLVKSRSFLNRRQRLEWRTGGDWERVSL